MRAAGIGHIEANQQDRRGTKLHRQIERLKPAVPAATDRTDVADLDALAVFLPASFGDLDPVDVREVCKAIAFPTDLQATEIRQALPVLPPGRVTAVDQIGPRAEIDILLDRDDPGPASKRREVRLLGRRARCNDDRCLAAPIRRPD